MPTSEVERTIKWMVECGWPSPTSFSALLVNEGLCWEGRREAMDAYSDTLSAVAFEAVHPSSGRFALPEVARLGSCAMSNVGLALYLLGWTDHRAAGGAVISGVDPLGTGCPERQNYKRTDCPLPLPIADRRAARLRRSA